MHAPCCTQYCRPWARLRAGPPTAARNRPARIRHELVRWPAVASRTPQEPSKPFSLLSTSIKAPSHRPPIAHLSPISIPPAHRPPASIPCPQRLRLAGSRRVPACPLAALLHLPWRHSPTTAARGLLRSRSALSAAESSQFNARRLPKGRPEIPRWFAP